MQKIFSLIIILLISNIIKISSKISPLKDEKIEIKVNSISIPQAPCVPSLGTYIFNINCEFSKSPIITQTINLNLSSNIKSICYPFENTTISNSFLQCEINTAEYPIKNENIYVSSDPPVNDIYTFNNWEEIKGVKISGKEIYCVPKALNSFIINEYKNEGCVNGNNFVLLKGKWNSENNLKPEKIVFNNNNINGECINIDENRIQCEVGGSGELLFYFNYGINVYYIGKDQNKNENKIIIKDCDSYYNGSLMIINSVKIILGILLLLF